MLQNLAGTLALERSNRAGLARRAGRRQRGAAAADEQHRDCGDADSVGAPLDPAPSTAIIIAIATSFGMPFPISTPPNAMVYGTGAVRAADLLQIGTLVMLLGCLLITFSGSWFLGLLGFG